MDASQGIIMGHKEEAGGRPQDSYQKGSIQTVQACARNKDNDEVRHGFTSDFPGLSLEVLPPAAPAASLSLLPCVKLLI